MRFFCYTMGDDSNPPPPPTPEMMAEMGGFIEEATKAGVLLVTGAFAPSAEGTKVNYDGDKYEITDGPFAEAKELVGGWALLDVRDRDEAIEWTRRFLSIVGWGESRIRPVYGPDDPPPGFDPNMIEGHNS